MLRVSEIYLTIFAVISLLFNSFVFVKTIFYCCIFMAKNTYCHKDFRGKVLKIIYSSGGRPKILEEKFSNDL